MTRGDSLPVSYADLKPEKATDEYRTEKGERLELIKAIANRKERVQEALVEEKAWVRTCIQADVDYFSGYCDDDYDSLELSVLFG